MVFPHLRLFGPPQLHCDERVVPLRTRKQLGLLVYLALEASKRSVSREVLIDLLWPDIPAARARHSLSQALTALRQALGSGSVTRATEALRLTCTLRTDLDLLTSAFPTLSEFDEPLKGLDLCAGPRFAHWVDAWRQRLFQIARSRLTTALEAARADGNVKRLHEQAAVLYEVDPLSEAAVLALAERMLLDGDRLGAIRLLRQHAARTARDVGCEPSIEIHRRLRRLEQGRAEGAARSVAKSRICTEPTTLVGRASELTRFESLWSETARRGLVTCLVTGPVGIGKSTLVRRFASTVTSRGWPAFAVACQEIGRAIPFAAVSDLVYALASDPAISGSDPMWLSEVSRVTPGIKSLYPGVPDPQVVPAESVRIRVAESIGRVLEVLGDGGPTLVVFDDVQHMDPATRDVLHVLLRRLEAVPTLLLGTLRTNDWRNFGLISDPGVSDFQWHETVPLKPFAVVEAEALIASRLCDAETIDEAVRGKIIELAEGNPYLLEMLLSDWQRDGGYSLVAAEAAGDGTGARWRPPDTMRRAFERQYRGLSSEAQRLLAVLAVAGKKITPSQISDLASLTSHEIDRAVFEAIDRGIVRVDGASFGFKNEMHRAFVYYALLTEESRKYHHARMARSFGTQPDAGDFQRALEGAHHFLKAGLVQFAIAQVIPGAEVAINRGAPQEAERALKEILSHQKFDNAPAIYILYAKSLIAQGQYGHVVNVLSGLAEARLDIALEAEVAVLKAEALHRGSLSDTAAIAEAAGAATRTAEEAGAEVALSRALQIRAEVAAQETDLEVLERIAVRSRTIAISTGNEEVLGLANITHAFCQMVSGEYREATRDLLKAELSMRKLSREIDLRMVLNGLGICHTNTGDFRAAESKFQEAASAAHRLGDCFSESLAWDNLGVLYDDLGWFDRAARAYRQALVLCLKSPTGPRIAHILSNMASLSISIGNLREAEAILAQAEAQARRHNRLKALIEVLVTRADLYLASKQDELAWQAIEDVRVLSAGKSPVDGTAGQFQRLNLQFLWATEGATAIQGLTNVSTGGLGNRLARRFEIQALIDMILEKERRTVNVVPIVQTIVEYGLFGVMARLVALRIWSSNSLQPRTGESGAHAVARLFPDPRRSVIPEAVAETSLLTECC